MHTKATQMASDASPEIFEKRNQFFEELMKQRDEEFARREWPEIRISLHLSSGDLEVDGKAWDTTPGRLLKHVPKDFAAEVVVAKVNGQL
jgi:hypothetical protein